MLERFRSEGTGTNICHVVSECYDNCTVCYFWFIMKRTVAARSHVICRPNIAWNEVIVRISFNLLTVSDCFER